MKNKRELVFVCLLLAFWSCHGHALAFTLALFAESDGESQSASGEGRQCSVSGTVASAITGAPINKATVRLLRLVEGSQLLAVNSSATTTESSGRFQMVVDPGRYAMLVTRNGYANQTAGMAGIGSASSTLSVACGREVTQLRFLMTPQGVIRGTVVDEDHEPMANVVVEAFGEHAASQSGRARATRTARTDDLGKYRIFGIPAGRYYVKARAQDNSEPGGAPAEEKHETSYVVTYYPDTYHAWAAAPIQVVSGQESEADITIAKVPTVHVAGKLLSEFRVGLATLVAYPGEHPSWDPGDRHVAEVDSKTGTWIFHSLLPGPYTITCDRVDGGVRVGARLSVTVGDKNIDNLEMNLSRYPELAGRLTVEGGGQVSPAIKISLQPRQALASMGYGAAQLDPDGSFFLKAVSPDLSDVTVSNLPSGYFVKSVVFSGHEVSDTGIELGLGGGSHTLNIVISPNGANLEGSVSGAQGEPVQGATVVLVPDLERRRLRSSFYTVTTGKNGGFSVSGIRPGEYTAVAWDSLDSIDYTDPKALDRADKQGQSLQLEEGGRNTVQLKVLLSASLLP